MKRNNCGDWRIHSEFRIECKVQREVSVLFIEHVISSIVGTHNSAQQVLR